MTPSSRLAQIMFAVVAGVGLYRPVLGEPQGDTQIDAVWRTQRIDFEYRGYSTIYTCSGLREKLRSILTQLGARDSIRLRAYACDDQYGSARFQIVLESPIPATPANIRALTTYSTEQELVARARGEHLPKAEDVEHVAAYWKDISFARDRHMRLEPGDCELILQLRQAILPRLAVRIVNEDLRCSPFGNINKPRLSVLALVADERH